MPAPISALQCNNADDVSSSLNAIRRPGFDRCGMERPVSRPSSRGIAPMSIAMLLLLLAAFCASGARAQQSEPSLPLSQRVTINLAAGVPEYIGNAASASNAPQSQWWLENSRNSTSDSTPELHFCHLAFNVRHAESSTSSENAILGMSTSFPEVCRLRHTPPRSQNENFFEVLLF